MNPDLLNYVVVPLLIFAARVVDVSMGTMRIILVAKSHKFMAATIGFFEALIWAFAIIQLLENLTNPVTYIAYALGFAAGTYVGVVIEEKIAIGNMLIQVITKEEPKDLEEALRNAKFRHTSLEADSNEGRVNIVYIIATRKNYRRISSLIKMYNPKAFFSVEDINIVQQEIENVITVGKTDELLSIFKKAFKRK